MVESISDALRNGSANLTDLIVSHYTGNVVPSKAQPQFAAKFCDFFSTRTLKIVSLFLHFDVKRVYCVTCCTISITIELVREVTSSVRCALQTRMCMCVESQWLETSHHGQELLTVRSKTYCNSFMPKYVALVWTA